MARPEPGAPRLKHSVAVSLPDGRITMLFTDIEGSTRLLRALGDEYGAVLARQRSIMRRAIADHQGHEMGTEGDSFFVVFSAVSDGVSTAIDAQRALAAERWPADAEVRVRMGLHVGEPARHEEGYMGLDLNRAARIASAANGGQIVVSAAVVDELGAVPGIEHRDLGRHNLKDLPDPEQLFQVVVNGLPDIRTPIKSLGAPSNLPAQRTELVGRDDITASIGDLVASGTRLVTLTGPGGTGKTSLALHTAHQAREQFPDGVYFVALESAREPAPAWAAVAEALGVGGEEDATTAVLDRLGSRRTLLVLDNLEQLAGAGALASAILDGSQSTVLATSRGPLHVRGEREIAVPPLGLPVGAAVDEIRRAPAVELFVSEAQRARPSFELTAENGADVAAICRILDGLPLAIELAAARVRLLSPVALADALGKHIELRSRGGDKPGRQQTLASTIAWSYDLLDDAARQAFVALAVFDGGCDLEAASSVLTAASPDRSWALEDTLDAVEALADVSLVRIGEGRAGEPRLSMFRVVREFALEAAPTATLEAMALAHARYWAQVVEEAEPKLKGPEQLAWADRLTLEEDNVRGALSWALDAGNPSAEAAALAARLAAGMGWFWYTHGRAREGRAWLERAVAAIDASPTDARLSARALHALGVLVQQMGDNDQAADALEQSLALYRQLDDSRGVAEQLNSLGITRLAQGRLDDARPLLLESAAMARADGREDRLASNLSNLGLVELTGGHAQAAADALREALAIDRRLGDEWGAAVDQVNLAAALVRLGQLGDAVEMLTGVLPSVVSLADTELLISAVEASAAAAGALDEVETAAVLCGGAGRLRAEVGLPRMPFEELYMERELGPVRATLGRQRYEEQVAAGGAMSDDELVVLALSLGQPSPAGGR